MLGDVRTMFFGKVLISATLAALALTACGDDANDGGVATRQLAARVEAAQLEAAATTTAATTTTPADVADPADESATPVTEATTPTTSAVEPTGVLVPVIALDNSFRPQVIEVDVGDEVVWENRGANEHNVLMVQDSATPFGVEVADFQPGDVYAHVFTEPGEFHYYCSIHGNETVGMIGTVVVTG